MKPRDNEEDSYPAAFKLKEKTIKTEKKSNRYKKWKIKSIQ